MRTRPSAGSGLTPLLYLDNAATSYPKPTAVTQAIVRAMHEAGGNPGRGGHVLSLAAAERVYEGRSAVASLFHSRSPENVVFTLNATHALNLAVKSMALDAMAMNSDVARHAPCRILISNLEHNAVYRTVCALRDQYGCLIDTFDALAGSKDAILASIRANLHPDTRLLVACHVSNLCGSCLPLREIGTLCHSRGVRFIVDASQSAGSYEISLPDCQIDALCAPGHKGLYGPQGTGFALFGDSVNAASLPTLIEGGTGVASLEEVMPSVLPERFEAGTLASPLIAGLGEGIRSVQEVGQETILRHETALKRRLTDMLLSLPGYTLYGRDWQDGAIVLVNLDGVPSEGLAKALNQNGVCVRGGYHCAPLAHKALGTPEGGAVRFSFSRFNTFRELDRLYPVLRSIAENGI